MSHSYQAFKLKKISKKRKGRAALGLPSSFSARRQSCYSDTFLRRHRVCQRGTASSSCYPTRSRNIPPPPKKKNNSKTKPACSLRIKPRGSRGAPRRCNASRTPGTAARRAAKWQEAAGSGAGSLATATAAEGRARKEEEEEGGGKERKGFRSREPQPRHAQPRVCLPAPCPERGARKRGASKGTAPPGVRRWWWRWRARPELFK